MATAGTMGEMEPDERYNKEKEVVTRNIAGETVIVPIRNSVVSLAKIFTLNAVASRIWELVDGKTSSSQIATVISSEFDVSMDQAKRDVTEFVAELEEKGLVQRSESA